MTKQHEFHDIEILGGRIKLRQYQTGYQVATDSILLASSVTPMLGRHILELGSGVGAVSLCLAWREPELQLTGYEINGNLVELANFNARENKIAERVYFKQQDVCRMESDEKFDQVMMNPPFHAANHSQSKDHARKLAFSLAEISPWCHAAANHLHPRGFLTMIFRADGLAALLVSLSAYFGSFRILPVQPRLNTPAKRIIIRARLGGKSPLILMPPLILHQENSHQYRPEIDVILRGHKGIDF